VTTKVEKTVLVDVPVRVAYDQWTQFESFPEFMGGVKEVRQLDDRRLHWVAEIAGVKREWDARILEQLPDEKIAWAATEGATNAGAVHFTPAGPDQTTVTLSLEYEPEGLVEKVGDKLHIVENQAEADLDRFKAFIEARGRETGGWRGTVDEGAVAGSPGVEAAATTRGDSGKAGLSGKAVVAGAATAAAGVAAASALKGRSETSAEAPPVAEVAPEEEVVVDMEAVAVPDGPLTEDEQASLVVTDERLTDPVMPVGGDAGDDAFAAERDEPRAT
jgi:hypothetical protein